jgi:hypothetical protein
MCAHHMPETREETQFTLPASSLQAQLQPTVTPQSQASVTATATTPTHHGDSHRRDSLHVLHEFTLPFSLTIAGRFVRVRVRAHRRLRMRTYRLKRARKLLLSQGWPVQQHCVMPLISNNTSSAFHSSPRTLHPSSPDSTRQAPLFSFSSGILER